MDRYEIEPTKSLLVLALAVSFSGATQAMQPLADKICTKGTMIGVACTAAAGYAGYKLYPYGKRYLENRIIDEAVRAIETGVRPVFSLEHLPAQEREKIMREKARLINVRKRVIVQLAQNIKNDSSLSKPHAKIIKTDLRLAKAAFAVIDTFRSENPYEKEYEFASTIDGIIDSKIVQSILLVTKPD